MQAVLSGSAAVALVNDGKNWHSIRYEDLETLLPQREEDFARLFHEARDLDWLDDTSLEEVRNELEKTVDSTEALSLVFDLLDRRLSDETRDAAALELDELALEEVVIERVENVLLATPLPEFADTTGARSACRRTNCQGTLALLESWLDLQEAVTESWHAWLQIPVERFGTTEDRNRIQGQLIRHGVFREMAHHCLEPGGINDVQFKFARDAMLKQTAPGIIGILKDWTEPFRTISQTKLDDDHAADLSETDFEQPEARNRRHKQLSLAEVRRHISHAKDQIIVAIQQKAADRTNELIEDLIVFHRQHSRNVHCCMSLCDLAIAAQQHGQFQIQQTLTTRAIGLKPDDAWAWTQYGKALHNLGNLQHAIEAYDHALEYGGDVVAQNGRAEVLKAQGKLDLALEAYDIVTTQHPENVVAQ
ncbi:MAG: tetratricopeptide repeat protein, partial [Planctomycetota bacterium]|nr:tetratricopeptide repeat protein [Planctomycetota bacterium]